MITQLRNKSHNLKKKTNNNQTYYLDFTCSNCTTLIEKGNYKRSHIVRRPEGRQTCVELIKALQQEQPACLNVKSPGRAAQYIAG